MSESPFFSIVTPTYNRESFLEEMILSISSQSLQDYEHIIVDDGSVDGTETLVKRLMESHPKIIYIKQENKGRSVARNVGIEAAKGQFVCFLDSDDVWLPNHLEVLNAETKDQTKPAMFHTGLIWFYDDGTPDQKVEYAKRENFSSDVEYVIANEFAPDCVCVHHSILRKHNFRPELFINEDVELWARIAALHPVFAIAKHTAKLRVHGGNTIKQSKNSIAPRMKAFAFILGNKEVAKRMSKSFIRDKKRGHHELLVRYHEQNGHRGALLREIVRFLLKYPQTPRNSAKLVTLLYNLPGGGLLKSLVAKTKRQGVQ
ncbi:MAG: glycosyltransferase family 2 protein [Flavobacteriales bacterium]|nr:glycosyltransferase family 2 protein [Flavobacteriales bacterium]